MLTFSEEQVRQLADADQVIAGLRSAFAHDFHGSVAMPLRTSMELDHGMLLLMPCYDRALAVAGVKLVSVTEAGGVNASYELIDPESGKVIARMEGKWLTDLRTAAASAVATDLLARREVETLGVFGTGRQARAHLAILPRVRKFKRFLVCGSGQSDVKKFCSETEREHGAQTEAVDAQRCARESDVVCTCTNSPKPLFDGRWLRPGTHLNVIGAFQPHTREVDEETVRRSRVIVDTYEGALTEAGDLLIPLSNGTIRRDHIVGDLHEIASGKKQGRTSKDEITLFKSVGCALEDLVTAQLIYKRATA